MSYIIPVSGKAGFLAYNSTTQSESGTSYNLTFDTDRNISITSSEFIQFPAGSVFFCDTKAENVVAADERFYYLYEVLNTNITSYGAIEYSGGSGSVGSQNATPSTIIGINEQGSAQTSYIRLTQLYSDLELVSHENRIIGFYS